MNNAGNKDLPDWITNYQSPFKGKADDHSGDSGAIQTTKSPGLNLNFDEDSGRSQEVNELGATNNVQTPTQVQPEDLPKSNQDFTGPSNLDIAELDGKTKSKDPGTGKKKGRVREAELAETISGHLPVVLPDKAPHLRLLLEVEGGPNSVGDLSGDSGAIGRVLMGSQSGKELRVDLKGVLLIADIVPLAGTAMVLNVQPGQAKVEAIMHELLQLRPDPSAQEWEDGAGKTLAEWLAGDQDDDQKPVVVDDLEAVQKNKSSKQKFEGVASSSKATGRKRQPKSKGPAAPAKRASGKAKGTAAKGSNKGKKIQLAR